MAKKHENNRRRFLKSGIAGITGATLLPKIALGVKTAAGTEKKNKRVYRTLGRTGIKVPVISIGATMNDSIILAAYDAGVRHFDTANRYGAGRHETMLGKTLKSKDRDSLIIATKIIPLLDNISGMPPKDVSPADFKKDFLKKMSDSLKRLQTDYVDILYLHAAETPATLQHPHIQEIMQELKAKKICRHIGVSFHHNELPLIRATTDAKIYDLLLTSYNFRQPHREKVTAELAYAAGKGLGTVGMKVMAGVYWDKEKRHPINPKASLKWCLKDPNMHTLIPRVSSFEELEQNVSVMEDIQLSKQEQQDLLFGKKNQLSGLYCAQCGKCKKQCRYNLEIPTAMRSYMYAYAYSRPMSARETMETKAPDKIRCRNCSSCRIKCTQGFDIRAKMQEIQPLMSVDKAFLV